MTSDKYAIEGTHLYKPFADKYTEYVGYEYKRHGTCENDSCGHAIVNRFTVKDPDTGETAEMGPICCRNWCLYHNKPIPAEVRTKYREAEKKYEEVHGTTEGFAKEWFEHERRKRLMKEHDIKRCDIPIEAFHSSDQANEAAKKYDGYCKDKVTMRGEEFWAVYLPRQLEAKFRGEYC